MDITIRLHKEDVVVMRNTCKILFLKANPQFNGMFLSDKFLFKKLVKYYQDETY